MTYSIEKNEQYALIRLAESELSEAMATDFETLNKGFFREGYTNVIADLSTVQTISPEGMMAIRKINRHCTNEEGLLVLVTKNEPLIELLDKAGGSDLTILPTVEEAVDAVFMNELENDFRSEDDDEYNAGGGFGISAE